MNGKARQIRAYLCTSRRDPRFGREENFVRRLLIAAALAAMACSAGLAQQPVDWSKVEIKTTDLGQNVYLLNWQGGDSLFLVSDDGVLLVDTSVPQMGAKIKAAIARV